MVHVHRNILTVYHSVKEAGQPLRIQIAACCFNQQSNCLVIIDKRGNIFVFDFVSKHFWRLGLCMPKATMICPSPLQTGVYIVGNRSGHIYTIDVDNSTVTKCDTVGSWPLDEISWAQAPGRRASALLRFGPQAFLVNPRTLAVSHKLEFNDQRYKLKFAGFLPNSSQFFTCFSNDSLHVWSAQTLNTLRIAQPIKARDQRIRLKPAGETLLEFSLRDPDASDEENDLTFDCPDQDFADGLLLSYCFTPGGNKMCLSTLDGYLMLVSSTTFELKKLYRLSDFILKQLAFLPQPQERVVFGITSRGQAIMLDLADVKHKLIVQSSKAMSLNLSRDGKLLSVTSRGGEVNVWSTCRLFNSLQAQSKCRDQVKSAMKLGPKVPTPTCIMRGRMNQELRQLLKPDRLRAMLKEFGCFPEKYRFLIWSSLLELPSNGSQFQELIKLGVSPVVQNQTRKLKISNESQRRNVIKVWACLGQWCKVLAHADFMPHLIYPFVKQLPKNSLVSFELIATLVLNHFQLWFEFHPLPPANYLGMCENLLQHVDEPLCKFYHSLEVVPKDYAWPLLMSAFAEVLAEQQWLELWDNIIAEPPWFPVFLAVAYNLVNREVILRLPDRRSVLMFFHDQNAMDTAKLLSKARRLMARCEPGLHPQRFMERFSAIPQGVYPKFVKYPSDWIEKQEDQAQALVEHNQEIDARIRHLEMQEVQIIERLENGLKQEEHERRIREMEQLYQDTMHREEQRLSCQRKMLLAYQMEVRRRKSEVIAKLQESEQRRKVLEMEKDIDRLMHSIERERRRSNQQMQFAEDEIRNQEMEILAQRYLSETSGAPLAQKYYDNIQNLCRQRDQLQKHLHEMTMDQLRTPTASSDSGNPKMLEIEKSILEIQREFTEIVTIKSKSTGRRNTT
ncbi:hypothetical protein KR018_008109 [Drosophila ironensis]|nr:hypothetical protein KR018_008109 [Drosophila ironensis]